MMLETALFALLFLPAAAGPAADAPAEDELLAVPRSELRKMWELEYEAPLRFDAQKLRDHGHACVSLGYIIERDGTTSTISVVRASPRKVFDAEAIAALEQARFRPGVANEARSPVYTVMTYAASGRASSNPDRELASVQGKCAVEVAVPDDGSGSAPRPAH